MTNHSKFPLLPIALLMITGLFVLDLFLHQGEAATFDSPIHITNMAMYHHALSQGDFPVAWSDGFANYGLPMPLVSQQITSYLGAIFIFITASPEFAYKIVMAIAIGIGAVASFYFLKIYTAPASALAGTVLYSFSAYRILNAYIRGALPELFAASLIPLAMLALHYLFQQKSRALIWFIITLTVLIAAHPFVFIISLFILLPYGFYLWYIAKKRNLATIGQALLAVIIALGLNAWYLFPLILEMKYFVISKNQHQLVADQFLSFSNYATESWPYFTDNDIFVRGNQIQFGLLESAVLFFGGLYLYLVSINRKKSRQLATFIIVAGLMFVFMTTKYSLPLYRFVPFLDGIQFPWRMLTAMTILPALTLSLLIDISVAHRRAAFLCIVLILMIRLPQVYGKNYTQYPKEHYYRTIKNLHFDSLNTIWTGNTDTGPEKPLEVNDSPNRLDLAYVTDCNGVLTITLTYKKDGFGVEGKKVVFDYLGQISTQVTNNHGLAIAKFQYDSIDDIEVFIEAKTLTIQVTKPSIECLRYPVKTIKGEIIEGQGQIISRLERNSSRKYKIIASEPVRMADYTFYFPGWKAYIDGQEAPIEFQDVNYRGVITYWVPAGEHTVELKFTPTKVRLTGQLLSITTLILCATALVAKDRQRWYKEIKP